jgi:hypothetical protein
MVPELKHLPSIAVALMCAVTVCSCGGSATVSVASHRSRQVRAASCPTGGEKAIERLRSTSVHGEVLAPAGTVWTTLCGGRARVVLKGGLLNAAINGARPYGGEICASDYVVPIVVILRYGVQTRWFVVSMSGCPGVVLHDGTELIFTNAGLKRVQPAWTRLRRAMTGS